MAASSSLPDVVAGAEPHDESRATALAAVPAPSDDADAVTLVEAARMMGVSEPTLRRRVHDGQVPAVREGQRWRISRKTVLEFGPAALKRESRADRERGIGQLAARAFALFAACTPLDDVVIRLEAPPEVISTLFRQWVQLREMSAHYLAPDAAQTAPRFDHAPNTTWDCCPAHRMMHATATEHR